MKTFTNWTRERFAPVDISSVYPSGRWCDEFREETPRQPPPRPPEAPTALVTESNRDSKHPCNRRDQAGGEEPGEQIKAEDTDGGHVSSSSSSFWRAEGMGFSLWGRIADPASLTGIRNTSCEFERLGITDDRHWFRRRLRVDKNTSRWWRNDTNVNLRVWWNPQQEVCKKLWEASSVDSLLLFKFTHTEESQVDGQTSLTYLQRSEVWFDLNLFHPRE